MIVLHCWLSCFSLLVARVCGAERWCSCSFCLQRHDSLSMCACAVCPMCHAPAGCPGPVKAAGVHRPRQAHSHHLSTAAAAAVTGYQCSSSSDRMYDWMHVCVWACVHVPQCVNGCACWWCMCVVVSDAPATCASELFGVGGLCHSCCNIMLLRLCVCLRPVETIPALIGISNTCRMCVVVVWSCVVVMVVLCPHAMQMHPLAEAQHRLLGGIVSQNLSLQCIPYLGVHVGRPLV